MTHVYIHGISPSAFTARVDDGTALSADTGAQRAVVDPESEVHPDDYVLDVRPDGRSVISDGDVPVGNSHRLGPVVELRSLTPAGERMRSNHHE